MVPQIAISFSPNRSRFSGFRIPSGSPFATARDQRPQPQTGLSTVRTVAKHEAHIAFAPAANRFFVAPSGSFGRDIQIGERCLCAFIKGARRSTPVAAATADGAHEQQPFGGLQWCLSPLILQGPGSSPTRTHWPQMAIEVM